MKGFSPRLFVVGFALGALGTAAALAASAYAGTAHKSAASARTPKHVARTVESGQPVIDWSQVLLSIVNTPGAQPANIQPTRNFAIVDAAGPNHEADGLFGTLAPNGQPSATR